MHARDELARTEWLSPHATTTRWRACIHHDPCNLDPRFGKMPPGRSVVVPVVEGEAGGAAGRWGMQGCETWVRCQMGKCTMLGREMGGGCEWVIIERGLYGEIGYEHLGRRFWVHFYHWVMKSWKGIWVFEQ